ncbi:unnamed protein product [Didymodactylos carnosus]|uniref:VCBS repeat-containing protein n=1 Tax=Didymodactylos carnosus TaxID=1234261 RepID=A0A815SF25_9BILA|nr:unnamed protein product [Didymodactylos carnosus]CAF4353017.1 unnamed protein product [Didymodactylos carnosus]
MEVCMCLGEQGKKQSIVGSVRVYLRNYQCLFFSFAACTRLFLNQTTYATGSEPYSLTVADFNGDTNTDLAVINANDRTVSILLGTGTGAFLNQTTYAAGSQPYSITSADFNNDTKVDLAIVNLGENTVSILLGTGMGTFLNQTTYATGFGPTSVIAADFNNDTKVDF